jgi:hypothetical protein
MSNKYFWIVQNSGVSGIATNGKLQYKINDVLEMMVLTLFLTDFAAFG